MEKTTELARAVIAAEQHFIIQLIRDNGGELIILVWPTRATRIEPGQLSAVTTAIVATLAEARTQLGLIRRAER
jgi:hypothetical protein